MQNCTIPNRGDDSLGSDLPVTSKTANYTIDGDTDVAKEFEFDSASAVTASLPAAASAGNGFNCIVRNVGDGDVTADPNGTEKIDGMDNIVIRKGCFCWFRCDGSNWNIVGAFLPFFTTPGNRVCLDSQTALGGATISFEDKFDTTYDRYEVELIGVYPDTNDELLNLVMRTGSTWQTDANDYRYAFSGIKSDSGTSADGGANSDEIPISGLTGVNSTASNAGLNAILQVYYPADSAIKTTVNWRLEMTDGSSVMRSYYGSGQRNAAEANNGLKFVFTNGADGGSFNLYGIKKP